MELPRYERQTTLPGAEGKQAIPSGDGVFAEALGAATGQVMENVMKVNEQIANAEFQNTLADFRKGMANFYEEHIYGNPNPETYQTLYDEFVTNGLYEETFQNVRNGRAQRMFEVQGGELLEQGRARIAESQITAQAEIAREEYKTAITNNLEASNWDAARQALASGLADGTMGDPERRQWEYIIEKAEYQGNIRDQVEELFLGSLPDRDPLQATQAELRAGYMTANEFLQSVEGRDHVMGTETGGAQAISLFNDGDREKMTSGLEARYDAARNEVRYQEQLGVENAAQEIWKRYALTPGMTAGQLAQIVHYSELGETLHNSDEFGTPHIARFSTLINNLRASEESGGGNDDFLKSQDRWFANRIRYELHENPAATNEDAFNMLDAYMDPYRYDRDGMPIPATEMDPHQRDGFVLKNPGEYLRADSNLIPGLLEEITSESINPLKDVLKDRMQQAMQNGVFGDPERHEGPNAFDRSRFEQVELTLENYLGTHAREMSLSQFNDVINATIEMEKEEHIPNLLKESFNIKVESGFLSGQNRADGYELAQMAAIAEGLSVRIAAGDQQALEAAQVLSLHQAQLVQAALGVNTGEVVDALKENIVMRNGLMQFRFGEYVYTVGMNEAGTNEAIYRRGIPDPVPMKDQDNNIMVNPQTGDVVSYRPYVRDFNPDEWEDITDQVGADLGKFQTSNERARALRQLWMNSTPNVQPNPVSGGF